MLPYLGDGALRAVIDDTLAPKRGLHVFGLGTHVDPVRSTKKHRAFCFGHCWVVLSVSVSVPFSRRPWALPVLFRLYRTVKECTKNDADYAKKTELARELLDVFVRWVGTRRVELAVDAAYCNDTVMRNLPATVVVFGAMRPDAVLTALPEGKKPGARGRTSKRGVPLPKPQGLAQDAAHPWQRCKALLYGRQTEVRYKMLDAQWYRACGTRLLRIVIVATDRGTLPIRVFFCTDATVSVTTLLETYAGRWSIEVFFREAKQLLGFADSSARKAAAVLRVAPFVGLLYTTLVLWFLEGASRSSLATPPVRPWYRHKNGLCFADVLRAAQRAIATADILDPANDIEHLQKRAKRRPEPPDSGLRSAA